MFNGVSRVRLECGDMKVVGAGLAKFGVGVPHTSIDVFGSIENVQKEYGDYYGFLQKWGMTSQLGALLFFRSSSAYIAPKKWGFLVQMRQLF